VSRGVLIMETGWQQPMPTLDTDYGNDETSEWLDIGPTVEEESGWGVEETDFTTSLDYSKFTPDQIKQAEAIARQIQHEQRQYGESRHFDKNMRDRRKQQQVRHDAAVGVHSAEDAIELLRRQKERQAAIGMHQGPPGHGAPGPSHARTQAHHASAPNPPSVPTHAGYNEHGAVLWLRSELEKCAANIKLYGNPPPAHAARFLIRFGSELLQHLPMPPPDVKAQVLSSFAQVGWDVRIRQPLKGSHPPNGQQLTSLAFGMCCYFSARCNMELPPPEAGIVTCPPRPAAPRQQVAAPTLPHPRQHSHNNRGGNQYPAPKPRGAHGHGGHQQNSRVQQPPSKSSGYHGSQRNDGGKGGGHGNKRRNNRGEQAH